MDPIKEAFLKIKKEMNQIKEEVNFFKKELEVEKEKRKVLEETLKTYEISKTPSNKEDFSTDRQTDRQISSTDRQISSTDRQILKPLNTQNQEISTRNGGVSTDRQTDRQTDRHINNTNFLEKNQIPQKILEKNQNFIQQKSPPTKNSFKNALDVLKELDTIQREIRLKFKALTPQEFLIFSMIYQFDEEEGGSNYSKLSKKIDLTESSVRDYVRRLISKGIPIQKNEINNKNIVLNISKDFKKGFSLSGLLQLRSL